MRRTWVRVRVVRKMSLGSDARAGSDANEGGRELSSAIPGGRAQPSQTFKKLRTRLLLPALAGLIAVATAYGLSGRELASTPTTPASDRAAPPPLNARPYAPDIRVGMGTGIRNIGAAAPSRGSAAGRNSAARIAASANYTASTNGRV